MSHRDLQAAAKLKKIHKSMTHGEIAGYTDGWLSPRLSEMFIITAELIHEDMMGFVDTYRRKGQMKSLNKCIEYMDVTRVDYLPTSVLLAQCNRDGFEKAFFEAYAYTFKTIADYLHRSRVPTLKSVHRALLTGRVDDMEYDTRKYEHFIEMGGRAEYALDAVLTITQNVLFNGQDTWSYSEYQDEIEAFEETPLDDCFDIARSKMGITNVNAHGPYEHDILENY